MEYLTRREGAALLDWCDHFGSILWGYMCSHFKGNKSKQNYWVVFRAVVSLIFWETSIYEKMSCATSQSKWHHAAIVYPGRRGRGTTTVKISFSIFHFYTSSPSLMASITVVVVTPSVTTSLSRWDTEPWPSQMSGSEMPGRKRCPWPMTRAKWPPLLLSYLCLSWQRLCQ